MKLEEIRRQWVSAKDPQASAALWDSQADDPTYHRMPSGAFIELLRREKMAQPEFDTLDLGCGVGIYSIALAESVHSATGIDISSKMLAHGQTLIADKGLKNVKLVQADWDTVDLDEENIREKYDLVFAHTSPAVSDAASLEKMIAASRRFCAVCNPLRMDEPVLEKVREIAEIEDPTEYCGNSIIYLLDMLLQLGYRPRIDYENQLWPMHQSFDDACVYYMGRVCRGAQLPSEKSERIMAYLKSLEKDGMIDDIIHATLATVYWEK